MFRVSAERLALPLALAALVAPLTPVQRLPHRGQGRALLCMVGVNGRLLSAVSLARLLDIDGGAAGATVSGTEPESAGRHAFARVLVLAEPGAAACASAFALPVDEVYGVLR